MNSSLKDQLAKLQKPVAETTKPSIPSTTTHKTTSGLEIKLAPKTRTPTPEPVLQPLPPGLDVEIVNLPLKKGPYNIVQLYTTHPILIFGQEVGQNHADIVKDFFDARKILYFSRPSEQEPSRTIIKPTSDRIILAGMGNTKISPSFKRYTGFEGRSVDYDLEVNQTYADLTYRKLAILKWTKV